LLLKRRGKMTRQEAAKVLWNLLQNNSLCLTHFEQCTIKTLHCLLTGQDARLRDYMDSLRMFMRGTR
jgi:hypothetical protein